VDAHGDGNTIGDGYTGSHTNTYNYANPHQQAHINLYGDSHPATTHDYPHTMSSDNTGGCCTR
jgi:hypothetical protein